MSAQLHGKCALPHAFPPRQLPLDSLLLAIYIWFRTFWRWCVCTADRCACLLDDVHCSIWVCVSTSLDLCPTTPIRGRTATYSSSTEYSLPWHVRQDPDSSLSYGDASEFQPLIADITRPPPPPRPPALVLYSTAKSPADALDSWLLTCTTRSRVLDFLKRHFGPAC